MEMRGAETMMVSGVLPCGVVEEENEKVFRGMDMDVECIYADAKGCDHCLGDLRGHGLHVVNLRRAQEDKYGDVSAVEGLAVGVRGSPTSSARGTT
jgi:hypothetical protein